MANFRWIHLTFKHPSLSISWLIHGHAEHSVFQGKETQRPRSHLELIQTCSFPSRRALHIRNCNLNNFNECWPSGPPRKSLEKGDRILTVQYRLVLLVRCFSGFPFSLKMDGFYLTWPQSHNLAALCLHRPTQTHKQAASVPYLFASRDLKGVFAFIWVPHWIWYWPRDLWENELPLWLWERSNPRFALEDYWVLRKALTCTFLVCASCIWVHNM